MKRFTKMIAVLSAAILILSLASTAFAEEDVPDYISAGFKIPKEVIVGYEVEPEEELPEETPEEEEGAEKPEPTPEIKKEVLIHSSRKDVVTVGERIYLTSELIGFEGISVLYQWQADRGRGWENVENANGPTYSFIATEETIKYTWRLVVGYDDAE